MLVFIATFYLHIAGYVYQYTPASQPMFYTKEQCVEYAADEISKVVIKDDSPLTEIQYACVHSATDLDV